jgi:hypothetical protein
MAFSAMCDDDSVARGIEDDRTHIITNHVLDRQIIDNAFPQPLMLPSWSESGAGSCGTLALALVPRLWIDRRGPP